MKKPRKNKPASAADTYLNQIEQGATRLALAREITQLARQLRTSMAEIQRNLRKPRVGTVVPLPEQLK